MDLAAEYSPPPSPTPTPSHLNTHHQQQHYQHHPQQPQFNPANFGPGGPGFAGAGGVSMGRSRSQASDVSGSNASISEDQVSSVSGVSPFLVQGRPHPDPQAFVHGGEVVGDNGNVNENVDLNGNGNGVDDLGMNVDELPRGHGEVRAGGLVGGSVDADGDADAEGEVLVSPRDAVPVGSEGLGGSVEELNGYEIVGEVGEGVGSGEMKVRRRDGYEAGK
ncbi:hypothetical protein HDU76_005968, partial [Blyttiomyces sp. JEL0837]